MAVDAGTIYSSIRLELDKIRGDIKTLSTEFNTFAKSNQAQAGVVEKRWTDSFKKTSLAGVAAFAAITLAIKNGIKSFTSFEQSLANVQSVARATPEEFAKLEEAARAAGETTKFTATEAANALYSLASAGLDATEATAALDGVLKLAGATQSDLAFTSATVTAALSQFGLEASQSTEVANVFAAAIGNSQANIDKLANAFRQVGPVAGALGISIEGTTGALQALFDAGFQGEQAGTALRNILSSLANQADPTVRKLNDLGIAFEDLNPTVNSVAEIIGTLNAANLEAGDLIDAFGLRAGPSLLSLLRVGQKGIEDYTEAVTGTNAAIEAYDIQMNTTEGDLAQLKSAVESTAISFVKEFAPAIRAGITFLTGIVKAINQLPGPLKIFLGIITVGIPIIAGLSFAVSTLAGVFGVLLGPISLVVAGIAAVVAITVALVKQSDTAAIAQKRLQKTSEELTKKIGEYQKATEDLEKALREGNLEEAKTLKLRQDLLKTQIAAALGDDIKAIKALEREEAKQNKTLTALTNEYNNAIKVYRQYDQALQDQIRSGNANSETANFYRDQLGFLQVSVNDVTQRLNEQKSVVGDLRLAREDELDTLANALATGQIEIAQIRAYDKALAKNIFARAEKIKLQIESTKTIDEETSATEKLTDKTKKLTDEQKKANEQLTSFAKTYKEKLEDINATELEAIELSRKRAIEDINATQATVEKKQEAIDAANKYFDALKKEEEKAADITKQTKDYELQLLKLVGTEQEVIEAERQRAIETALASGASSDAIAAQVRAINNLYDELLRNANESLPTWLDENKKYIDAALNAFSSFIGSVDNLFKASADNQITEIERTLQATLEAINIREESELKAAGLIEETRLEALQRQLAEAAAADDQETSLRLQNEIDRLQITEKYEAEKAAAKENAERKSAQIEYNAAISSWRLKILSAIADAGAAITGIWAQWAWNPVAAGLLTAGSLLTTGLNIAAIRKAKPEPPAFQTGGIVLPAGSAGRQVTVAENGAPELLLNGGGEGSALLDQFAERIVRAMGTRGAGGVPITILMDIDGRRLAQTSAVYYNNGNVPLRVKL